MNTYLRFRNMLMVPNGDTVEFESESKLVEHLKKQNIRAFPAQSEKHFKAETIARSMKE